MIISIPNPPMGPEDVKRFREIVSGKCTEEERQRRIPEGYLTLEEFGELFHQKLETCYENR